MTDIVLYGLLTVAACFDWHRRKIPNALTFPVMITGLCHQWQAGTPWAAIEGVAGAFLLTLLPVACKGMGMGDQKLLMAFGAWSSWDDVYSLFWHSVLLCLLAAALLPRTWNRLWANLKKVAIGWRAHRQLWFPGSGQAAFVFPYAVFLLGAFFVQQLRVWEVLLG